MEYGESSARSSMAPLLDIQNLRVAYASPPREECPALAGVTFDLAPGEILGVLGESGSGKSTLAAAIIGLSPPNAVLQSGSVRFEGKNLSQASARELQSTRGSRIGFIFQEPSSALHPTLRVREQVAGVIAAHTSLSRQATRDKAMRILETVLGSDAQRISRAYPHELSGGQKQRVLIAQAIANDPALLIADEPTASLDPTTLCEILLLFQELRRKHNLAILLVTHNPRLLSGFADRILVLYAGRVVELGPAAQILTAPKHPYTAGLLRSLPPQPGAGESPRALRLPVIPGEPPDLSISSQACRFEPRCPDRMAMCNDHEPDTVAASQAHSVSCFKFHA